MHTSFRLGIIMVACLSLAACSSSKQAKFEKVSAPSVASADPNVEVGRQMYEQHCQQCHRLPDAQKTPMMKFDRAMPAMVAKSKLTWSEGELIMTYIKAAQKTGGGGIEVSPNH